MISNNRPRETSDKIETWEDLLEARDKTSHLQAFLGKGGPAEPGTRGGVTRTSFLNSVKIVYGGTRMRLVTKASITCRVGLQAKKSKSKENNTNSGQVQRNIFPEKLNISIVFSWFQPLVCLIDFFNRPQTSLKRLEKHIA